MIELGAIDERQIAQRKKHAQGLATSTSKEEGSGG